MYKISNFLENPLVQVVAKGGSFKIIEYKSDMSCKPSEAMTKYFMAAQNVRSRQIVCSLEDSGVTLERGAMQWFIGDVSMVSGIKGVGDAVGKMFASKVTGETAAKPEYTGTGMVVTEPSYNHYILVDLDKWKSGIVIQDGMFAACENTVQLKLNIIKSVSGAALGGEGLFLTKMIGSGWAVLECRVPESELIVIDLYNDVIKIDGKYAIAWSGDLKFTVERSAKTLTGSALSGEGLVNVYRGTGRVIMMPQV